VRSRFSALGLPGVLLAVCVPALARAVVIADDVSAASEELVVVWSQGVEVIAWRTTVARPTDSRSSPRQGDLAPRDSYLVWLVTLPADPIDVQVVPSKEFASLTRFWRTLPHEVRQGATHSRSADDANVEIDRSLLEPGSVAIRLPADEPARLSRGMGRSVPGWIEDERLSRLQRSTLHRVLASEPDAVVMRAPITPGIPGVAVLDPIALVFRSDELIIPLRCNLVAPPVDVQVHVFSTAWLRSTSALLRATRFSFREPSSRVLGRGIKLDSPDAGEPVARARRIERDPTGADESVRIFAAPSALDDLLTRFLTKAPALSTVIGADTLAFTRLFAHSVRCDSIASDPQYRLSEVERAGGKAPLRDSSMSRPATSGNGASPGGGCGCRTFLVSPLFNTSLVWLGAGCVCARFCYPARRLSRSARGRSQQHQPS